MSPEQARGRGEADVRSDIYACGVILFEAVTGKLPFTGETFNDLMFKIALSETPSPLTVMPSLDPEFAWIIERAMARDPANRFQSVQEFSEKLDEWMRQNELTGTLAQPLPSEAFPPRAPTASAPSIDIASTTIEEDLTSDLEQLQLQKTGIDESWARSQLKTSPLRRRNLIAIVAAALAALGVVTITAVALKSGGTTDDHTRTAAAATTTTGTAGRDDIPPPPDTTTATTTATAAATTTPAAATSTAHPSTTAAKPVVGATAAAAASAPHTKGSTKKTGPAKPVDFGY
jgi:serine/threonine-protein kinase